MKSIVFFANNTYSKNSVNFISTYFCFPGGSVQENRKSHQGQIAYSTKSVQIG